MTNKNKRALLIEKAEQFFFEAMRHGWASGEAEFAVTQLPNSKIKTWTFPSEPKDFKLMDSYYVANSNRSYIGIKVLYHDKKLIWYMSYGGWYEKRAIALLKEALMHSYKHNQFRGARGPASFYNNSLYPGILYTNHFNPFGFGRFRGREFITDGFGKVLGEHNGFGGLVI